MTKKEITGNRKNDLFFSGWIRNKLPDSYSGFRCYDIDFVIWNKYNKTLMILELKSNGSSVGSDQKLMLNLFHNQFKKGIEGGWKYKGLHLIRFEKNNFKDGKVFLNNKEINENEMINFLTI